MKFSYYKDVFAKENTELSIDNYIGFITHGANQDLVLKARAIRQQGNIDEYKKIKSKSSAITGSCVFHSGKDKIATNIKELNGLIVIDIDEEISEEQYHNIKNDKYTFIIHRSFSGFGWCVFIKINSDKFEDSFNGISEYYFNTFDVTIDQSCKNQNRLRYISFDPDLYQNPKSNKFIPKNTKKFIEPKNVNFVYVEDDFQNILQQIKDRSIDLCNEDYFRYVRIGMSLASKFGLQGSEYFHFICSYGGKYNEKRAEKDYQGFCRNQSKISIGTFYYYCKEQGLSIYSDRTKKIIDRVKIAKVQGNPSIDSIVSNLKTANEIEASEEDKILIKELIESKIDYSKEANSELTEIEQLEKFIIDNFQPRIDVITNITYILDNVHLTDTEINDIYLSAKKNLDFNISKDDIRSVINSNRIDKINTLSDFFRDNKHDEIGYIEQYAKCVYPQNEFNIWAFKKWIVGAVHNWTAQKEEKLVCPLTLVLTGQQHGTGKTSFLRNIMPKELDKYLVEGKINGADKDSTYTLCNSLMVLDDEFGGKAFKDVKEYKSISDINIVTQRRPYERESKTFKRRAILCGTTNEIDILKDVTGNRRILPINVEKIDYDMVLSINKNKLIVEAYNLLKNGFDWIIRTEEDIEYLKINSESNENIYPIEEIFFEHFQFERKEGYVNERIMNQGDILEYLNRVSTLKPNKYDLKEIFTKNKISYQNYKVYGGQKKGIKVFVSSRLDENLPF
jgi:predicted P-loop ATPase